MYQYKIQYKSLKKKKKKGFISYFLIFDVVVKCESDLFLTVFVRIAQLEERTGRMFDLKQINFFGHENSSHEA